MGNLLALTFANRVDGYALLNAPDRRVLSVTLNGARSWHRVVVSPGFSVVPLSTSRGELYTVIARCSTAGCPDYLLEHSNLSAHRWTTASQPRRVTRSARAVLVWGSTQPSSITLFYTWHDQGCTFTRARQARLASANGCACRDVCLEHRGGVLGRNARQSRLLRRRWCPPGRHADRVRRYRWWGIRPGRGSLAYLNVGQITRSRNLYRISDRDRSVSAVGSLVCAKANGLVLTDAHHGPAACDGFGTNSTTELLETSDGGTTWTLVRAYR